MKSLIYLFRRYPLASVLNLLGLVLAFAGAYLLLTQIRFVDSYNRGIQGYEHIRRIYPHGIFNNDWSCTLPRPFLEKLKTCPQIEHVGFMANQSFSMEFDKEGSSITVPAYYANADLLLTVNATCVDGELVCQATGNGAGIVIPASLAEKYFGTVMATGKQMKVRNLDRIYTVTGVYQDFPANSTMINGVYIFMGNQNINDPSNWNYSAFIRIRPDVDEQTFEANYQQMFKAYLQDVSPNLSPESADNYIVAMPLCETYLNGHDPNTDRGNKTMLFIQKFAVLLLLLVLLINFANFTMAQAPTRLRGINTRKVMGESNERLRLRLVGESIVVSLAAWGLAMGMVYLIGRWGEIGQYILGSIQLQENGGIVLTMGGISVLVGVLASIYSAYYITSFQPALVLKGNLGLSPQGKSLRQLLVGLQLVLSFTLVLFISTIYCQNNYIRSSDYGYQKDALLFGSLNDIPSSQKEALRSELEKMHGVESVSYAMVQLGLSDNWMEWGRWNGEYQHNYSVFPADWKILRTLGIDIIEGRDFKESDGDVCIVNEALMRKYPDVEVDKILDESELPVVGVCKNFRAFSTRIDNSTKPIIFVIYGEKYANWGGSGRTIYIRMAPNTNKIELRKRINQLLVSFAGDGVIPELKFQDECLEQIYHEELRFMKQMQASTLLTFLITLIGVFCLTMFETEYRRKEIAIRKVMGSSVSEVLMLFMLRYSRPLIVSFILATPLGYYLSEQWLQNFAEHTPIYGWIFPLVFVLVSAMVLTIVVVQSWRVATTDPIDSLKTE